jgi:ABC-2 type transport system permease protein
MSSVQASLPVGVRLGRRKPRAAQVAHQARYELKAFWRSPEGRFFTLVMPVLFLVLFTSVFGDGRVDVDGRAVPQATYYVGHLAALGVISASFTNLVISIVVERESGILKRRRATPAAAIVLIAGRVLSAVVIAIGAVACLLAAAWILYGVEPPLSMLPAVALATVVGATAFACLGFALTSFIGSADGASPVVQGVLLPLYFISGVFVPSDQIPAGLLGVADALPVRHLAQALYAPLHPGATGSGIAAGDLLIVALWGAVGLLVATRNFSWSPRS